MFVCKAHGSLNRFPLRLCVISTKPNSFSDKVCYLDDMIDNHRMAGLGTVFKVIEVHGQGTRDTVQNPKAKCTNLSEDQAGPQVPCWGIHSLLSQGSAPLVMRGWQSGCTTPRSGERSRRPAGSSDEFLTARVAAVGSRICTCHHSWWSSSSRSPEEPLHLSSESSVLNIPEWLHVHRWSLYMQNQGPLPGDFQRGSQKGLVAELQHWWGWIQLC